MTRLTRSLLSATLMLSLGLAGCAADLVDPSDETGTETFNDADQIASSLELENGGLDMANEAALFDEPHLFEESGLVETEVAFEDAIESDAEVQTMLGDVDAVLYHTTIMWGQFPGDRANDTPYNWSGGFTINRGAIIVRSVLAFDGRIDRLAPRDDPRVVAFRSATLPHRDGLRLLIVDPDPTSDEPLVLTYRQANGNGSFTAPIAAIVGEPLSQEMDDAGNRIVAVAMRQPVDVCEHGFLGGRWHKVADGRGRILGRVAAADGTPVGHVRGIYGHRRNGDRVFFMKYINRAGQFQGILRGVYGEGHFVGRWMTRNGERGVAGGEYRETAPGPRVAGHFLGRWAERTCDLDIARD